MAKYKVGDKVLVRKDLNDDDEYWMADKSDYWLATDAMVEYAGKVITIKAVKPRWYLAEGFDDTDDFWTDEMFEGLAEEKPDKPFPKYKIGDKVRVRSDLEQGEMYGIMCFTSFMKDCVGKVVTIESFTACSYKVVENDRPHWTDEMFVGLAEETPAAPITVNLNINIDNYANACWHCRKGGIVDLYLNGKPGICPTCGRVCNVVQKQTKPLFEEIVSWDLPSPMPKENKPLTREELAKLPEGARVFTVWMNGNKECWDDDRTRWRINRDGILRWEIGTGSIGKFSSSIKVYLEEPERPF